MMSGPEPLKQQNGYYGHNAAQHNMAWEMQAEVPFHVHLKIHTFK